MSRRCLALVLALAAPLAAAAQERPTVVVTDPSARNFKAAVQEFAPGAPGLEPARFREDVVAALVFSGVFEAIDPAAFLGARRSTGIDRPLACADWSPIGSDALVEGVSSAAGAQMAIDFRVWDVTRCAPLLHKRYTGGASDARRIARRLADDVVAAFTGKPGVASTEITFVSSRSGKPEIHVMDADGGSQRQATRNRSINAFPSWSPDGSAIVYMSYLFDRSPKLFRLVRSGGARAGRILEGLDAAASLYRGVYDPSGTRLAVVVSRNGSPDIWLVDADGRNPRQLTKHSAIDVSPSWSPDGRQLAFVSDRAGAPNVYVMNADGSGVRRLTYEGGYNTAPAWSPDGRWIAHEVRVAGQFDLWLVDPEGRVRAPLVTHARSDENPSWAPDGRKLAFHSARRGKPDLYVIDVDGENLQQVTQGAGDNTVPSWGPYPR